ncbi:MAG TPA: YjjG family noncanonical pyrimidine nucleotidase [Mucilaginibacter sp.]|nr:YjjG family noncanonical pyrimidine nucleotidase [Mucilaginibacter sp.]
MNSAFHTPNFALKKHLFFDLDHTIWDFDKNAEEALHELYGIYGLKELGLHSADLFIETYTRNNHRLWAEYHLGRITKDELREARFKQTFLDMGMHPDVIPVGFEDHYVRLCPTKTNLFPDAHETLQYLQAKYVLHLISNGFRESTEIKISGTNLGGYFQNIIISEIVGVNKPDRAIFQHALDLAGAEKHESLMIGDSLEADVYGAMNFGMDAVYFNPNGMEKPDNVPVQISQLKELVLLL